MEDHCEKFQSLLRELFQFDCADLDFGIYRIMNYKRDMVERFITQELPKTVAEELNRGALADQSQAAEELKHIAEQIRETLGKDALDADGNLAEIYHETRLGKKYLNLKRKAAGGYDRQALQATIFNHLYTFFSRYYQDGDFISKRRYSKRQKYAIPYNGEEVYLYWANHDQYYIKTAEHFHDYTYSAHGVTVHFKLVQANVEQNNVKGEKRFFLPRVSEINWDEKTRQLIIPFEYRPLTEQEVITYGNKNQQENIIAEALEEIPNRLSARDAAQALKALTDERHKTPDGQSVSFLAHHLRQYTRRNTSDFFIHKDLKGFLTRELDFYLKNEVLNLDEIEAAGQDRAEAWFQLMRVIKAIGRRIIDFLAQIEDFQKMLWEKRKFITETQYCITVGNIDESFYSDIAACDAQWDEWKELFHIDEEETDLFTSRRSKKNRRIAFLKAHPTLVVDTKHFDQDFVDRLLASFDDLDELTDGLLVHSENWQALNLLLEKYREKVKCIYIDPPYNTGSDEFLYRDSYQHSCWLTMMRERINLAMPLFRNDGVFFASVDDNEMGRLRILLDDLFNKDNFLAELIWDLGTGTAAGHFTRAHEYILSYARYKSGLSNFRFEGEQQVISERAVKKISKGNPASQITFPTGIEFEGKDAIFEGEIGRNEKIRIIGGKMVFKDGKLAQPVTLEAGWAMRNQILSWLDGKETYDTKGQRVIRFYFDKRGRLQYEKERGFVNPQTVLRGVASTRRGTQILIDLFGSTAISFPKPIELIKYLGGLACQGDTTMVDFFAGSGTTGHAVINLNREDGGKRKFILVEMGNYFDTVLLPRIKKVTFTPEWKDGKPKRMATGEEAGRSPRIVKYIRLESYEDALNNIEFDEAAGQRALEFDDYLLQYMLKWETRKSETLLNTEKLASPFSYKLHIHADLPAEASAQAGGQTREKVVDIPETFNYLLGLHVKTRRVLYDGNPSACGNAQAGKRYLVYRGRIDHREVVVIWRENKDWTKEDLQRDKDFVAEQKLTDGADEVYVNGDSLIRGAKALEPVFKARMFAPVEA